MAEKVKAQAQPNVVHASSGEPVVLPDVATQAHPSGPTGLSVGANSPPGGDKQLQNVLPAITEVAQKVGGFKKLSEIADTLDEMGK